MHLHNRSVAQKILISQSEAAHRVFHIVHHLANCWPMKTLAWLSVLPHPTSFSTTELVKLTRHP